MSDVDDQFHNLWPHEAPARPFLSSEVIARACKPLDFWELLLVRFYGKRLVSSEDGVTVEIYKFNGCFYVTRVSDRYMGLPGCAI